MKKDHTHWLMPMIWPFGNKQREHSRKAQATNSNSLESSVSFMNGLVVCHANRSMMIVLTFLAKAIMVRMGGLVIIFG